ncbi:CaiB/BaiF CoA transferase family protein [Prauserella muralis]|uniref:Carnitine dehydratase n=1 Tax=Prauserella muralis TaxID=588067 RepID=A0A2V4AGX8_9PSEU|nr:CaiB/BaiF CoA-transferase family protein [Prauserella muralis]PXY18961.1 carnitine dehydratase [Prauserella muralis]TWE28845.1 alpha-methylacyl-CoA racemase [Prauserella muralis]
MGPLSGIRVLELGGIGPAPHAAMLLGDLGADVVRVQRKAGFSIVDPGIDHSLRSRRSVPLDFKDSADRELALALVAEADVIVEGFRPGVAERLGLGPDVCLARNPRLVYGRVTGWGREGPLADEAGHDINYLGLTGTLHAFGPAGGPPVAPLNLVGDFGGGSMFLALGVVSALWERERSGRGQVVDAAMVDGVNVLAQAVWAWRGIGYWSDDRGANLVDGAAPFYRCYACADGRYVTVGAIEPQFYAALLEGLGLAGEDLPDQHDREGWPGLSERFAAIFATRTRDDWVTAFAGTDACVGPVLDLSEALQHPQARAREAFARIDGVDQPVPAPRFSRTSPSRPLPPSTASAREVLAEWRSSRTREGMFDAAG